MKTVLQVHYNNDVKSSVEEIFCCLPSFPMLQSQYQYCFRNRKENTPPAQDDMSPQKAIYRSGESFSPPMLKDREYTLCLVSKYTYADRFYCAWSSARAAAESPGATTREIEAACFGEPKPVHGCFFRYDDEMEK